MVVFEAQTGSIAGYSGRCDYAHDSGAQFTFDAFGTVQFNSNGYGENANVKAQLDKEYGRYFCSTSTCGGLKNWVSSLGTVTEITKGCRVTVTLTDYVTKTAMADVKCCLGLMCQYTNASGEAYLGQFVFGTYGLVIAKTGYDNLIEDIVLSTADLKLARCLTPTGEPGPGTGCDAWPTWLRPFCIYVTGLIAITTTELTTTNTNLMTSFQIGIKDMYSKIDSSLISPIWGSIQTILTDISALWTSIEEVAEKAAQEATEWRKGITDLDKALHTWIETSIIDILIGALDREVDKGKKP